MAQGRLVCHGPHHSTAAVHGVQLQSTVPWWCGLTVAAQHGDGLEDAACDGRPALHVEALLRGYGRHLYKAGQGEDMAATCTRQVKVRIWPPPVQGRSR